MTPEEKSLLERTHKLTEENNAILRGIRRSNRISLVLRILYWVLILALAYGSFYLIQPYFNALMSVVGGKGGVPSLQQSQDAAKSLQDLFK